MKKYIVSLLMLTALHIQSSEYSPQEVHGTISTFQTDGYSETPWVFLAVPYEKGGIYVPYPEDLELSNFGIQDPGFVNITPIALVQSLQNITPVVVRNEVEGLTIVVSVLDKDGVIREAEDDEVLLHIFSLFPNEHVAATSFTGATGLGSFDFGGTGS